MMEATASSVDEGGCGSCVDDGTDGGGNEYVCKD
jgi:hypothetical protein